MQPTYHICAPGRIEIGGNHTDHQNGCVLTAAVEKKTHGEFEYSGTDEICILSEGYPEVRVSLSDLSVRDEEKNTTAALVRGIAAAFRERGAELGGFCARVTSDVKSGSGLSSSAAFEVMLGTAMNHMFLGGKLSPIEIAKIGQFAEREYFGKPCGLLDQMASAVGGLVFIDFQDPAEPMAEKIHFDFCKAGYEVCMLDSFSDHADLTEEYAAIPQELAQVCAFFGKKVLREVKTEEFFAALPRLREKVSHRALLRAIHIFHENERAIQEASALKRGDIDSFLSLVKESGRSSFEYLQNISPSSSPAAQPLALTLAVCEEILGGKGAFRVHGGGFAGMVLAFVPKEDFPGFQREAERLLGKGVCFPVSISPSGGCRLA